ncbi:MAG: YidC/Oxa1 family membrane protein insertase [Oscillospiraceae bacterium]|nr:YidC/Oxa1 family membrane protein insertase [Oscillospiraceae bacterium]
MLSAIAKPFGMLMLWLYEFVGNYGVAVILFALIVKLILLPFQMKSKKGMIQQTRLQGRIKEIEKRHGANKQKYNEEVQKLYREEGVNPMSGCIWSLIPFPILIALYQAIRYPLTIMMGVGKELLDEGGAIATKLTEMGFEATSNAAYVQIEQSQFITNNWSAFSGLSDKLRQIDYNFLGLDLGKTPQFKIFFSGADWSDKATVAIALLAIIPVVAAVLTWLQTWISQKTMPKAPDGEEDPTKKTMGMMNIFMPIMTLWFAFIMPAALGLYWIASSVFALIQEVILNKYYGKKLAIEDAERMAERAKREKELEEKRLETERLKAENATERNTNTSKKKQRISDREDRREKTAEWERKKGLKPEDDSAGRVDDRKYARGRAYDPDRYAVNAEAEDAEAEEEELPVPETSEEAAAAALPEPEDGEAVSGEESAEEDEESGEEELPEEEETESDD